MEYDTTTEAAVRLAISDAKKIARLEMALEAVRYKLERYILPAMSDADWRKVEANAAIERIDAALAEE